MLHSSFKKFKMASHASVNGAVVSLLLCALDNYHNVIILLTHLHVWHFSHCFLHSDGGFGLGTSFSQTNFKHPQSSSVFLRFSQGPHSGMIGVGHTFGLNAEEKITITLVRLAKDHKYSSVIAKTCSWYTGKIYNKNTCTHMGICMWCAY